MFKLLYYYNNTDFKHYKYNYNINIKFDLLITNEKKIIKKYLYKYNVEYDKLM